MADSFDDVLAQFAGPRVPGQPRLPVRVDHEGGTIELCGIVRPLDATRGNRGVLETFVELVTEVRSARPSSIRQLRRVDLVELASVLDLTDEELERDLEEVLGIDDALAGRVVDRLHRADRAQRAERLHNPGRPEQRSRTVHVTPIRTFDD